jgi:cytochrome c-type biogenesis protein CcmH/NrfG
LWYNFVSLSSEGQFVQGVQIVHFLFGVRSNSNNEQIDHFEHLNQKKQTNKNMLYQKIINWCLYIATFLVPVFFLPWTLDPLEINKQTLLVVLILMACLAAVGKILSEGEIKIKKNLVNISLVFFLVFLLISTLLSSSHLLSWAGTSGQEYTSFVSLVAFAALFCLVGNQAKDQKNFSGIIISLIGGAIIAGVIGLLQIFGVWLPFSFAQTKAFNTVGTLNSLGIFLAIVTILANAFFIIGKGKENLIAALTTILSLITFVFLILNNYSIVWWIFFIGLLILIVLVFLRAHELHHTKKYLLAMLMAAGSLFFIFAPIPSIYPVPAEVTLNTQTSLEIAKQTLTNDSFLFGSGPGTYLYDYAKFRPLVINQTSFWNTRFNRASSEVLTMVPTKGLLSSLALLFFTLALGFIAFKRYFKHEEGQWRAFIFIPAWSALTIAFFLYTSNFTLSFLFFLLSGLIYTLVGGKIQTVSLAKLPKVKIATSFAFIVLVILVVTTLFLTLERFSGEYAFAKAVRMDRGGGGLQEIIKQIDKAATINRFDDTYYRNLAEALFLEVKNQIATFGTNQPTEEQSKYLQALIATSINAAKHATDLEPKNVLNWLELGSIYRSYIPVMNETGQFAILDYQTAITLEPNNPSNYVELGKTYLAIAAVLKPMAASTDAAIKQEAETKISEAFAAAETNLKKAIELKSDYAYGHYQLAIAYQQQGKLDEAISKMESIVNYNQQDVGAAFELGVLYLQRLSAGDLTRAEQVLNLAVKLLPSYSNAHWYLAFVYEQQGNKAAAISEIEKVLELNPENEMVKTRLETLKNSLVVPSAPEETTVEPIDEPAS